MRMYNLKISLLAGLLVFGTVTAVAAQSKLQGDVHHPEDTQVAQLAPVIPGEAPAAAAPEAMPGMGMMTPEMTQMMMSGQAGTGMPEMMDGQGILYGTPFGTPEEMTEARVALCWSSS